MGGDPGNYYLAPEGTDSTIALLDQLSHVFSTADFGYNNEDKVTYDSDGNPIHWQHYGFSSVKITALDLSVGTLTYNGAAVTAGTTISIFQLANLVYTAPADTLGKGVANIQFSVTDSNGGIDSTPNTLTIDLATLNSAPVGANKTITILEDHSYTPTAADFGFSDPNDAAHPNKFYGVWLDGIHGYGQFSLNGQGFGDDRWVSAADVGKLLYTAQANYNGDHGLDLDFWIYDDGGTEHGGDNSSNSLYTVNIKVISVNDAPSGADNTVTYLEDSGKHVLSADLFGFSDVADSAAPNNLSKVIIDKISGGGTFMLGNTEVHAGDVFTASQLASFTFQAAGNGAGASYASLKFRLVDDGGTANGGVDTETVAHTLTFDVTAVNDSPVGTDKTIEILEDSSHVFTASDFGFSDPDDGSAPNSFATVYTAGYSGRGYFGFDHEVVGNRQIAVADIGKLVYDAEANDVGEVITLEFNVQDNGGDANGADPWSQTSNTITIKVISVNDAPTGADNTMTFLEDSGKHVLSADLFGFADASDSGAPDSLAKAVIDKIAGKGTFMLGKTEVHAGDMIDATALASLTFQSAKSEFGNNYASLKFRLVDDGGTDNGGADTETVAHTLKFNITDVTDKFIGTAAKNVLRGTVGHDVLDGKGGNDKLTGLGGSDTFVFSRGYGKDAITDFDFKGDDHDTLDLRKLVGVDSFKDLLAHHIEKSGTDVIITGDHGDQVTLSHLKIANLVTADFLF